MDHDIHHSPILACLSRVGKQLDNTSTRPYTNLAGASIRRPGLINIVDVCGRTYAGNKTGGGGPMRLEGGGAEDVRRFSA